MAHTFVTLLTLHFMTLSILCFSQVGAMSALSPMDPSSYSRPEIAKIKHISLVLGVDFENKILHGLAELNFDVLKPTDELILDVSKLKIESIQSADGTPLNYQISEHIPNYGSKLTVTVPQCLISCDKCNLKKEAFKDIKVQVNFPCAQRSENPQTIVNTVNMSEFFLYKPIEYLNQPDVMESINSVSSYNSNNTDDSCKCCQCNQNEIVTKIVYEGDRLKINVKYTTSPTASALQWLEPNQTSGKEHPYMFSQCQPIHARSIVPCQDTPAVKFTYEAAVEAPPQFTVLMSALRQECAANRTTFRQPVPVPAYLLAIAVGAMEHRRLGPRLDIVIPEETSVSSGGSDITLKLPPKNITEATTEFAVNRLEESDDYQTFRSLVWTEKAEIERSAWEFAETEKYLQAAEALCGPYQWTQYDLVVLPPSFPYGGMENPCLTFVTPTLLAGDRSQADVIVHEIMHSWTGNLVTNRNFEHFWLNEGFTVFLERKVAASLVADAEEAKRSRDFESLQGLLDLREAVMQELGETNPLTKLVVDLKGVHPDDAFSTVPYEKGSLFLRYLENLVGGAAKFDDFMRSYLNTFQRQSLDTEQFKAYFLQYFEGAECPCPLDSVDWDAWLHTSGMPPVIPHYDTSMTKAINALLTKITKKNATFCYSDVKEFTPHQVINLLQQLLESPALDLENLRTLGNEYKIAESKNSEIKYRWLRLCIRSKDDTVLSDVYEFINQQGRMKYVRPIYRDLYAWEDVRQQTIANFLENEPYMMHVSAYTIRKDLHLDG